jgi:uncharacterized protein YcbK (DUF882 family)
MRRPLAVAAALFAGSTAVAYAETLQVHDEPDKKDRYLARKQAAENSAPHEEARARLQHELDRRIGNAPDPLINIRNLWTREVLAVPKDPELTVGEDLSHETLNWFLRCRFTDEPAEMDERLAGVLVRAATRFGAQRVEVVSGYRSQKHNLNLRKKGSRVARNSQHTHGTAVDFRVPGVHVSQLHRWARSLGLGGVGYYPRSGFVHIDTADVRYWTVR